jgi:hypothetical protein
LSAVETFPIINVNITNEITVHLCCFPFKITLYKTEALSRVQIATAPTLAAWSSAVSYSEGIEFESRSTCRSTLASYLNFSQFLQEAVGTAAGIVSVSSLSKFVSVFLEIGRFHPFIAHEGPYGE